MRLPEVDHDIGTLDDLVLEDTTVRRLKGEDTLVPIELGVPTAKDSRFW